MEGDLLSEVKTLLDSAQNILILTKKNPTTDDVAASLALYESLSKVGKIVTIACPTPLTVSYTNLFAVDRVEDKIGSKNLVISLDYTEGSIEKVSYNVDGNKFNLVIQPKAGFPPFSPEKVSYAYSGINAHLIFIIGCKNLTDLDNFYLENKDHFEKTPLINICHEKETVEFGIINLINNETSSCSQIVLDLLKSLDLKIDPDTASNLLTGIESATSGFKFGSSPETFEAIALCLRLGGKRYYQPEKMDTLTPAPIHSLKTESPSQPAQKDIPVPESANQAKSEEPPIPPAGSTTSQTKAPPDWLQPKIYKGGQLL